MYHKVSHSRARTSPTKYIYSYNS